MFHEIFHILLENTDVDLIIYLRLPSDAEISDIQLEIKEAKESILKSEDLKRVDYMRRCILGLQEKESLLRKERFSLIEQRQQEGTYFGLSRQSVEFASRICF